MGKRTIWGADISTGTKHWESAKAWCEANGIDTNEVYAQAPIVIDYDTETITVTEKRRHQDDPRRLVMEHGEPVRVETTYPMKSTPEEHGLEGA